MAKKKRQKVTRFSIQSYDAAHYRQTEQYANAIDALFDQATAEVSKAAAKGTYNPDKPFSFDDYPGVKAVMQGATKQLAERMITVIETGSKKQWLFACDKNDGFIASIMDTSKVSKARLSKMQDRNLDALQAFQQRKVEGLNLSERVWKYVGQYRSQLESALDVGLGEGRSAQQLARDVKGNLRDPNRLFRRVRDKRGNLVLSKAARAFHPGQGVYRSSVKNAQRLTRSEINMAYRESDFARWQSLDFVVGFEIKRSNHEPLCDCDLCAKLVGRYPKTFKFVGWHPQCMCFAVPILMDEETFDENELGDLKAALHGTQYTRQAAKNLVSDVPDGFKEWVKDHADAQKNWGSTPYFIRDNFKHGKLSEGLKIALPTAPAPAQPVDVLAPYRAQIAEMRAAAVKWGLQVQVDMLDKYVADKDITRIESRMATIRIKVAEIEKADADVRAKCREWGLSTYILDDAMRNPDAKNILAQMAELETRAFNAAKEYKQYITDATNAAKEARKLKIDVSGILADIATVTGDKREWLMGKASFQRALAELEAKIQEAGGGGDVPWFLETATPEQKHILSLNSNDEIAAYMVKEGFASEIELGTMPLEHAKQVCATAARYVQEWGVAPFKLAMARMGNNTFAHACGAYAEFNPSYFNKKNAAQKIKDSFEGCAGNWRDKYTAKIKEWKGWADGYRKKIDECAANGNTYGVKTYRKYLREIETQIKQYETDIAKGHTRHNVFLSEQSLVRNITQHELGHLVEDQLMGSFNGSRFMFRPLPKERLIEITTEINALYSKYKNDCGWLSTYGKTARGEFVAECMVLYMERGGKGLPSDVKAWFDKLKRYANSK